MYYYVGNDGTVIKRTKLEMYNEKSGVWKTLTDKVELIYLMDSLHDESKRPKPLLGLVLKKWNQVYFLYW